MREPLFNLSYVAENESYCCGLLASADPGNTASKLDEDKGELTTENAAKHDTKVFPIEKKLAGFVSSGGTGSIASDNSSICKMLK